MHKYSARLNGFVTSHLDTKHMSTSPTLELLTHARGKEVVIISASPLGNLQT